MQRADWVFAFGWRISAGRSSTTITGTRRAPSSHANNNPAGPPPTIITAGLTDIVVIVGLVSPAVNWTSFAATPIGVPHPGSSIEINCYVNSADASFRSILAGTSVNIFRVSFDNLVNIMGGQA
jgi:hypothetical protein